jgi:hypothetical protein
MSRSGVAPALLLFPDYPDGTVDVVPGREAGTRGAVDWLSGGAPLVEINDDGTAEISPPNAGTDLVGAVARLTFLDQERMQYRVIEGRRSGAEPDVIESLNRLIRDVEQQFPAVKAEISHPR